MRSQWSSRLTAIQSHLDAQKRASILEETEAVDRKASLTEGKSEEFMAPKGVISLAFTDIQGSTRLWEHFGEVRQPLSLNTCLLCSTLSFIFMIESNEGFAGCAQCDDEEVSASTSRLRSEDGRRCIYDQFPVSDAGTWVCDGCAG